MGRLVYSMSVSLDGFAAAADGSLDWVQVDDELHAQFNDDAHDMSTFLYGRRMYELMAGYWPTAESDPSATPVMREFARLWATTPKIVFSGTLGEVAWNSRLVREGTIREVARLRAKPGFDMGVGGPTLAGSLLRAGLIDEFRLFVNPVVLGTGLAFFPTLDRPIATRLVESRTFGSGVVFLRYQAIP